MYVKILRSIIRGGGTLLDRNKVWLEQFYVGDKERLSRVLATNTTENQESKTVFDAVVQIRTIALIENVTNAKHAPYKPKHQTEEFLSSPRFESMVQCLAAQIADIVMSGEHDNKHQVRLYLATDGAHLREPCAKRLKAAVEGALETQFQQDHALNANTARKIKADGWIVTVDYFSKDLPPSHFHDWTDEQGKGTTNEAWNRLVGTTAEWLLLSSSRSMLQVKGFGGQNAVPSSFAQTAAVYGGTSLIKYFQGSRQAKSKGPKDQIQAKCVWKQLPSFSSTSEVSSAQKIEVYFPGGKRPQVAFR